MRKRLPEIQALIQVYAVIAVMFVGWTITAFFWKLSAWLLLLNLGEILTLLSYALFANFIESLLVLCLLLLLCALLPGQALRDDFMVRGTILSIGLIGSLMAFVGSQMRFGIDRGALLLIGPLLILILMTLLLNRSAHISRLRSAAIWVSDRVIVFLFLLVPLFVIASLYVVLRNIA